MWTASNSFTRRAVQSARTSSIAAPSASPKVRSKSDHLSPPPPAVDPTRAPPTSRGSARLICTMRLRTRSRSSTVNMRYPAPYSFVYLARRTQSDSDRGGQENVGRKASIPLIQALGEAYSVFDAGFLRPIFTMRSEEHTSELQSLTNLVCRLLLEKKKTKKR